MDKLRATASLPIVSQIVEVDGKKLLDGGTADSIPIFQFRRMGYRKDIVVLTRPEGYVKEEDSMLKLEAIRYKEYPEYVKRIAMRHLYYNKTLEKLAELEQKGEVLIIRPSVQIDISRTDIDALFQKFSHFLDLILCIIHAQIVHCLNLLIILFRS